MAHDPREAVIQQLCAPPAIPTSERTSEGGITLTTFAPGVPWSADPNTVVFRKERDGTRTRLFNVSYSDTSGQAHVDIVGVTRQPDGSWLATGSAGGSGYKPARDKPWVNFGGWWGPDVFCAGGDLVGSGAELARHVQLVFGDGTVIEDTVDDGLVLFLIERGVQPPATARILGANGDLLATHPAFPRK
jgi:hypothetical protein